jgi:hypothetical protein
MEKDGTMAKIKQKWKLKWFVTDVIE